MKWRQFEGCYLEMEQNIETKTHDNVDYDILTIPVQKFILKSSVVFTRLPAKHT